MREALTNFFQKHLEGFEEVITIERLSGGASQETYHIIVAAGAEKHFAFRKASLRETSGSVSSFDKVSLRQEAQLMQLAHKHNIPEPRIFAICEAQDGLGEGFMMEWLEGETLGKKILQAPELEGARKTLAHQCGVILAAIHQIPQSELSPLALPTQEPQRVLAEAYEIYQSFALPRPMIDWTAAWLKQHLPLDYDTCLTHSDFRNGNLMVSPQGIIAVLDWELACISDPMRDLGWLCANCWRFGGGQPVGGFGSYEALFDGYQQGGGGGGARLDRERVKFWEVMSSFRWAIMCLGMGQAWRSGADKSVERAAIGRRASESELDCANLLLSPKARPLNERKDINNSNMPTKEELIQAVRDYLLSARENATTKRDRFLSLVSANSLDIVLRELKMGASHESIEKNDLQAMDLEKGGDILTLRKKLIEKIKSGQIALDDEKLQHYLRGYTLRQVLIDQPNYSGVAHAIK